MPIELQRAPWSAETIAALNAYQREGRFHPYTCGNDSRHRFLVATPAGWVCLDCDYQQTWAHADIPAGRVGPSEV